MAISRGLLFQNRCNKFAVHSEINMLLLSFLLGLLFIGVGVSSASSKTGVSASNEELSSVANDTEGPAIIEEDPVIVVHQEIVVENNPVVDQGSQSQTPQVDVGGTPQVDVGGTPQVDVGGTPQVDVGGTPQIDVGGTPQVNPVILPQSAAEIEAFVLAIKASDEVHVHDVSSLKMPEHMAALDLVPRAEATHIAIGNGSWFDPDNWYQGRIPDADAKVLIPDGVNIVYDDVSDTRLFTVRVDGQLEFSTDTSSQMIVDTLVISPGAKLTIGTVDNPVADNVDVNIIFANNGPIDVDWDPLLLSRGMIAHGEVNIHGSVTDSHEKVIYDPMVGDTWVEFAELPEGWAVGDTIVIAGTRYDGYKWDNAIKGNRLYEPEDEIRTIASFEGGRVNFDEPLEFDHDTPRDDLKTSVANYTRNVTFSTENPDTAEIYERGHVMFMHNDDVDVRYAEFNELGRTDKSEPARDVSELNSVAFDSNIKARYSFHLHRAGVENMDDPAIATGNAVFGSPGWGFVQHDSNAILDNNASYDTFGAGYVAETGNETGSWTNNIAIYAEGVGWGLPKVENDYANFDNGKTGDGFWFQGRMVDSVDNIAASVNTGFIYFHRGSGMIDFDAKSFFIPDAFYLDDSLSVNKAAVVSFSGNETFAAREGLRVVKHNPTQSNDIHSVFEDFTAWEVKSGAHFAYTSKYLIKDFDLIGKEATPFSVSESGISFGTNVSDMTIVDALVEGFGIGIDLEKKFVSNLAGTNEAQHEYTVVNATFIDVAQSFENYNPAIDNITSLSNLNGQTPDIKLDGPLTYKEGLGERIVEIQGSKFDGLGRTDFPSGTDNYNLDKLDVIRLLENDGYYTTTTGQNYFMLDMYFSDRLTGDIFLERHPVYIDDNVPLGSSYHAYTGATNNGVKDPDVLELPEMDSAMLWAQLTAGQIVYSDAAIQMDQIDDTAIPELAFGI